MNIIHNEHSEVTKDKTCELVFCFRLEYLLESMNDQENLRDNHRFLLVPKTCNRMNWLEIDFQDVQRG